MPFPFAKRLWRSTLRAVLNPGWKDQALRSRQLSEAVTRFEHRAIYRDLTSGILQSISDDNLIQVVYDSVETRLPDGHSGVLPIDVSLPRGCIATYYFRAMDYNVWNGGFDQFFDEANSDLAARTIEALRFLGLVEMADLTAEAQQRFAADVSVSQCDARHAELQPAAEQQVIHFIREHPGEFITA